MGQSPPIAAEAAPQNSKARVINALFDIRIHMTGLTINGKPARKWKLRAMALFAALIGVDLKVEAKATVIKDPVRPSAGLPLDIGHPVEQPVTLGGGE